MYEREGRRETESISFRLDTKVVDQLRSESQNKEVSLNTLASQILRKHIEWDNNAAKAGLIPFPKSLLRWLFDQLEEDKVRDAARYIAESQIRDIILLLRKQYEFETFIDVIVSWFRVSHFPYTHTVKDSTHTFVIQHDMGKKYSIYFAQLLNSVCEDLASRPEIETTANSIVFKVDPVRCGIGEVLIR